MKIKITFQDPEEDLVNRLLHAIAETTAPVPLSSKETAPVEGFRHIYMRTPRKSANLDKTAEMV